MFISNRSTTCSRSLKIAEKKFVYRFMKKSMYIRREKRNIMNNNNFYQGYKTYLNYFRQTFGNAPVPSYNEWLQQFPQPNVVNSLSNHDNSVPESAASSSTSECSDQVTDLESSQVVKKKGQMGKGTDIALALSIVIPKR